VGGRPVVYEKPEDNDNDENGCAKKNADHFISQIAMSFPADWDLCWNLSVNNGRLKPVLRNFVIQFLLKYNLKYSFTGRIRQVKYTACEDKGK
jgi:hypothetical protein